MGEPAPGMSRQVCLGEGEGFYLVKLPDDLTFVNILEILLTTTTIRSPNNGNKLGMYLYI